MQYQIAGIRLRSPGWEEDGSATPPILIELTAKRWKGLLLIAWVLAAISILLLGWQLWTGVYQPLLDMGLKPNTSPMALLSEAKSGFVAIIGYLFLAASIGMSVYARFMAWWRHG